MERAVMDEFMAKIDDLAKDGHLNEGEYVRFANFLKDTLDFTKATHTMAEESEALITDIVKQNIQLRRENRKLEAEAEQLEDRCAKKPRS